jgi:uncharacterized protein
MYSFRSLEKTKCKTFINNRTLQTNMEDKIMDQIMLNSQKQIAWAKQFTYKRSLYKEVKKIDSSYYTGIKGIRGIGKTVLLLQIAKETNNAVYFSADSTLVKVSSLYQIVKELHKRGFTTIFIDEIHRKAEWDKDIKTLYDEHEVRIFFTGSSAIDITQTSADLSRRVVLKELLPVSFREFLIIRKGYKIPQQNLKSLICERKKLTEKYGETYQYMKEYSQYGGMLFPKNGFYEALENALRKVILQDLAGLRDINVKYETDVYTLLRFIAQSPPFEINYTKIAKELEISKTLSIRMVQDLKRSGVIIPILPCKKKGIDVKKEPKIYLTIPLRQFFQKQGIEINKGAEREEFFVNHTRELCYMKTNRGEKTADFRYNDIIIEVGGASKKQYQKPDFIAVDSLATDTNKIPLFLFGFLY